MTASVTWFTDLEEAERGDDERGDGENGAGAGGKRTRDPHRGRQRRHLEQRTQGEVSGPRRGRAHLDPTALVEGSGSLTKSPMIMEYAGTDGQRQVRSGPGVNNDSYHVLKSHGAVAVVTEACERRGDRDAAWT